MSKKKWRNKRIEAEVTSIEVTVEEPIVTKKFHLWITISALLAYIRTPFFDWVYFDDHVLILDHLWFIRDIGNFFNAFKMEVFHVLHASAAYYRPILTISFMLDAQLSGERPFFYHLTDLLIHLIVSNLVFVFLHKLNIRKTVAFIFALVFAVHPVLTQATAWVPGRNDSLLALFLLPAMIYFLDYIQNKTSRSLILHILFFSLSMYTKESAILLPVMCGLYLLLFTRKVFTRAENYILGSMWVMVFVVWFFMRQAALENPIQYTASQIIKAFISNTPAVLLYLGKVLFPFNLSVLPTLQDSTINWGLLALILVAIALILSKWKNIKAIIFGIFWYLIFLYPSFIRPSSEYVPDFIEHRLYVPIIGLFIIFSQISFIANINLSDKRVKYLFTTLILLLGLGTFVYSGNFANKTVFWKNAVKHSPNHPLAQKNLGAMYYLDRNLDEAEKYFRKSLELNPTESMIHNNIGLIYLQRKNYEEAEKWFAKELELYPYYDNAHFNWGLSYYTRGEIKKAEEMWLKTVQINPDHTGALRSLALYYLENKDDAKAKYYYNEAVKRGVKF